MPHLPTGRRYFRVMPPAAPARVDEELRFHFEARIDELLAQGRRVEEARAQAEGEFGDVSRVAATVGCVVGLALAIPVLPLIASQLFGVSVADPISLAGVPLTMLTVALVAALVPARRAMRADPIATLRAD